MSSCLLLLSLTVLVCKVHSQLCIPPILSPPCSAPCIPISCQPAIPPCPTSCPQVINPNPYVTTIIDTSVSNALINALQLLIISNLIGSTVGQSSPLISNLGPLLDSLVYQNSYPVEVVIPEYVSYAPSYDIIPPYGPITTCAPYYEYIPPYGPACGSTYELIPPYGPLCGPSYELISPYPIIDTYANPFCGLPDIISPNFYAYSETIAPICIESVPYNGYSELILPISGMETIVPNLCGGLEIIPSCLNYPDICPVNPYYGGFAETMAPCLTPLGYAEPFGSIAAPNFFGGLAEMAVPAELTFPSTISSPLSCNLGHAPASLPCVKVNVDPYDNCLCNGLGNSIYY